MKKQLFYAASLFALFAMGSCSEDQIIEDTNVPQTEVTDEYFTPVLKADFTPMSTRASRVNLATGEIEEEAHSRHHVGLDGKANWVEGDRLTAAVFKKFDKNDPNKADEYGQFSAPLYTFVYSSSDGNFKQIATEEQLKLLKDVEYYWIVVNDNIKLGDITYRRNNGDIAGTGVLLSSPKSTIQSVAAPEAHLASMDLMRVDTVIINNPKLTMKHVNALMTFDVVNKTTSKFELDKVLIESCYSAASVKQIGDVSIDGSCIIEPNSSFTVAVMVSPFFLSKKDKFRVSLHTDQGVIKKIYTVPNGLSFNSGTLNSATVKVTADDKVYNDNNVYIPDADFRKSLCKELGKSADKPLTKAELETIKSLKLDGKNISSLEGIEYLTNLETLHLSKFHFIEPLDLSSNTQLKELNVSGNQVYSLDLSHNTQLQILDVSNNNLFYLDLSHNTQLGRLNVANNQFEVVDISKCSKDLGTDAMHEFDATGNSWNTIWVWDGFFDTERPYCKPAVTSELYRVSLT